jgi:hypothetical protein
MSQDGMHIYLTPECWVGEKDRSSAALGKSWLKPPSFNRLVRGQSRSRGTVMSSLSSFGFIKKSSATRSNLCLSGQCISFQWEQRSLHESTWPQQNDS